MLIELATDLANRGFNVFPCLENSKVPAVTRWNEVATKNQEILNGWFSSSSNLAIHTNTYNDYNLVVLDIDVKGNRNGFETLSRMNVVLPETFSVKTPSGGMHYYYITKDHVKNGVNAIGPGIDVRASNGYVLAPGSSIDGKKYEITKDVALAVLPENILSKLNKEKEIVNNYEEQNAEVDYNYARLRFETYLKNNKNKEINEGERSTMAYRRAAVARDYGLNEDETFHLMEEYFITTPPMDFNEMLSCVKSAYKYAKNTKGFDAPEKTFLPSTLKIEENYLDILNKKYALVFFGGGVAYIEEEFKNNKVVGHKLHTEAAFKVLLANQLIATDGGKQVSVFNKWKSWPGRRQYDGIVFDPSNTCPANIYNSWTGFDQKIKDPKDFDDLEKYAVTLFTTHMKENISDNDASFYNWFTSFLANIIQNPGIKYPNCVVLQGSKGTGKSLLMDIMAKVIGRKYVITLSDIEDLLGQFNSVADEKLLINLDEAYWAGRKSLDASLKNIISSNTINIKAKYLPPKINTQWNGRIISTTNEEHAVNATSDERRYTVKTVNDAARYNHAFFDMMIDTCLTSKGANAIFNFLRTWDISKANIKKALETKELSDQKILNISPVQEAWKTFITTRELGNLKWTAGDAFSNNELLIEIQDYVKRHYPSSFRYVNSVTIGKEISKLCPSSAVIVKKIHGSPHRVRIIPTIKIARYEFEKAINVKELEWDDEEEIDDGMDLL